MKKILKPISDINNKAKNNTKSMIEYRNAFNQKCIERAKTLKFDKHGLEREYVNRCKFKTRNSNDIKFALLLAAEETIDRKGAVEKLQKCVKVYHIVDQIEKGIYEFALVHVTINGIQDHYVENVYNDKLNDLCDNLDINNKHICNTTLLPMILEDKFNPYFIAFLTPDQLHPKRWGDVITKQQLRENAANELQTTDIYKCAKCGDRRFKITELQLRSADENMSKFFTCMTCYTTFIK